MRAMTLDRPTPSPLHRTLGLALAGTLLCAAALHAQQSVPATSAPGQSLLDGRTLDGWTHVGPGRFVAQPDGSIVAEGGAGLLYFGGRSFRDFALDLDYLTESDGAEERRRCAEERLRDPHRQLRRRHPHDRRHRRRRRAVAHGGQARRPVEPLPHRSHRPALPRLPQR
jgi:hypothetical protein